MKTAFWRHATPRQRLLAIAGLLGLLFLVAGVDWHVRDWPTSGHLQDAEKRLKSFRRELASLEREDRAQQRRMDDLRRQGRTLWRKPDKNTAVLVQGGLDQAARRAGVTLQNAGTPRTARISDNLSSTDLSLRVTGGMHSLAKFLAELERSQPAFTWASCTLRPDNPRDPQGIILDGRLQALQLSPEAAEFLADPPEGGAK
ncbi:MAG: hypothetical protein WC708_10615 [Lentisphaeria bacterium]